MCEINSTVIYKLNLYSLFECFLTSIFQVKSKICGKLLGNRKLVHSCNICWKSVKLGPSVIQNELKTAINAYLEIMGLIFLCNVNEMH